MKRLTCEMCGSTDLMKDDGVFVCQSCGMKYSVEEAKKMMVKNTVDVQGTVTLDENKTSRCKPLFVFLAILASILILSIVTMFVVMTLLGDNGEGNPVALPSNVVGSTLEPSAPASTIAPTNTTTASPITTLMPTKTPVKTALPTPAKTATPTSTPTPTITPSVSIGDIIKFGTYEQDNNTANGQEEIEWIVLDKKDGKALIISKYGLDAQPYNITNTYVTWETCTLRNWLNRTFYPTAFNANQQSMIASTTLTNADNPSYGTEGGNDTTDKVFLLSIDEVKQYFASDTARKLTATVYAKAQGVHVWTYGNSSWWLRTPGESSSRAAFVHDYNLSIFDRGDRVDGDIIAVRPALWINLES